MKAILIDPVTFISLGLVIFPLIDQLTLKNTGQTAREYTNKQNRPSNSPQSNNLVRQILQSHIPDEELYKNQRINQESFVTKFANTVSLENIQTDLAQPIKSKARTVNIGNSSSKRDKDKI